MMNRSILVLAIVVLLWIGTGTDARYSGGTGEPNDPYRIATPQDLNDIGKYEEDWDRHFILVNDVNLAGYTGMQFKIIGSWIYRGNPNNKPFAGVFDGNDHKIWNFTWVSAGRNAIGLFGYVGASSKIKNLGLENVDVNELSGSYVGGLVGWNSGTIINCYSSTNISGTSYVGGLVGQNGYYMLPGTWPGWIYNCYSVGSVSGTTNVGGLVAIHIDGEAGASFWDIKTSGQSESAGGTPKTTTQMKTMSTFTDAGWDFVEIWGIGENQTYPYLRTEPAGDSNYDKKVDLIDLAILASHWLEGP